MNQTKMLDDPRTTTNAGFYANLSVCARSEDPRQTLVPLLIIVRLRTSHSGARLDFVENLSPEILSVHLSENLSENLSS